MILILIGLKHCGKSTAAGRIAERAGCKMYDIDEVIQERTGMSAREMFKQRGAGGFRAAELDACRAVAAECALHADSGKTGTPVTAVIAAGGGICDNQEALSLLNSLGITVFLDASFDIIWARIEKSAEKTGEYPAYLQTENPRADFQKIFEKRRRIYLQNSAKTIDICSMNAADDIAGRLLS